MNRKPLTLKSNLPGSKPSPSLTPNNQSKKTTASVYQKYLAAKKRESNLPAKITKGAPNKKLTDIPALVKGKNIRHQNQKISGDKISPKETLRDIANTVLEFEKNQKLITDEKPLGKQKQQNFDSQAPLINDLRTLGQLAVEMQGDATQKKNDNSRKSEKRSNVSPGSDEISTESSLVASSTEDISTESSLVSSGADDIWLGLDVEGNNAKEESEESSTQIASAPTGRGRASNVEKAARMLRTRNAGNTDSHGNNNYLVNKQKVKINSEAYVKSMSWESGQGAATFLRQAKAANDPDTIIIKTIKEQCSHLFKQDAEACIAGAMIKYQAVCGSSTDPAILDKAMVAALAEMSDALVSVKLPDSIKQYFQTINNAIDRECDIRCKANPAKASAYKEFASQLKQHSGPAILLRVFVPHVINYVGKTYLIASVEADHAKKLSAVLNSAINGALSKDKINGQKQLDQVPLPDFYEELRRHHAKINSHVKGWFS